MSDIITREQKYQRLRKLSSLARERYFVNGGDSHKLASGNLHLTKEEKQEFATIARELSDNASSQTLRKLQE